MCTYHVLFSSCRQGWGWLPSFFLRLFFPRFTFLSLRSIAPVSNSPIFCCCSPFSSHSFPISLNAVLPSHSLSSSPPFSLHFLGICSLCQFSSPVLSTCPAHFSLLLASFFFKLSFTPHTAINKTIQFTFTQRNGIIVIMKYCITI